MKVIVKSYKPSGKWYHTEETQIELQTIDDVLDLEEKIKCNDESIQHLSGLKQGFNPYYTYMIELESDNLFMDYVIHSNEFIRSSEVFSEKEKNEKLEKCNDTLFKAIEEVNRINKKLEAENEELKKLLKVRIEDLCDSCGASSMMPMPCKVYEKTLIEIKEIAEHHNANAYCNSKIDIRKILQKISECEVDNA